MDSINSMQELDPSPVHEELSPIEFSNGNYFTKTQGSLSSQPSSSTGRSLGLSGCNWDSWFVALQRYSTYPPTVFFGLHFANTSLIPLITRSVSDSENYLLLTRPFYQSPSLEHVVLTAPILIHIVSGIALRNIRSRRRARLYGAETRSQRYSLSFWPRMSLQSRLGYLLIPLLGAHALVNRVMPVIVDGGSSGVGLGYVAHGFARSPVFWNTFYTAFVAAGVWHIIGGWAAWMGWKVTTVRKERGKQGSIEYGLGETEDSLIAKKQKKSRWLVSGTIAHNGKEYKAVREGLAYILNQPADATTSKSGSKNGSKAEEPQSVFYNPIQQFNRDLSVLAIKAYGRHAIAVKEEKAAKRAQAPAKGKKRKREDGNGGDQGDQGKTEPGNSHNGDQPALEADAAQKSSPSFTILDALSATGLRALRYALELPFTTRVVANDFSLAAIQAMKTNIEYNGLQDRIQQNTGDARAYMYNLDTGNGPHTEKFDVIDLDPYGTAAPFMDAAVQGVKDGGLLCVTCTDAGVWASTGYPEKTYALYGGVPLKGTPSHEGGLRLILHALATSAAKYGLAIEPLLSLSIDFYARVFVRVHRSPAQVKFTSGNTMLVYNCDAGCGAWSTQPLTHTKHKLDKKGGTFHHYGIAQGPVADAHCEHCGRKTHLAGPMWAGPLHNPDFIRKILAMVPTVDRSTYQTMDRLEGMLTTALEEDLTVGDPADPKSDSEEDQTAEDAASNISPIFPRADPSAREPHPFYFTPAALCKVLHTSTISADAFRGALRHLGYRSTRSHAKPNTLRTDAPWDVIWEIMREWVRQKSPIKQDAIKPGTAGATIMAKSRENIQKVEEEKSVLDRIKDDIISATQAGADVNDVVTKVEAALYRSRSQQKQGQSACEPSKLEVVFDESLGRDVAMKKRLVRYQLNPRANWGPLNRASGGR
ncbi:TRM-domain-containing protein [Aspergillus taichungensis]|uniref:tRNA (guanine(26)-N(2))-dimethyltransferase n=1 Tax=Aspergillus taichungensis TaxID=482145 RepID=A0A2J5HNK3_9EURO|nr:TRM-domain-containing protein [Aspergillus taichungensis]